MLKLAVVVLVVLWSGPAHGDRFGSSTLGRREDGSRKKLVYWGWAAWI